MDLTQKPAGTALRVTLEMIANEIVSEWYFTADEGALGAYTFNEGQYQVVDRAEGSPHERDIDHLRRTTICVLVLKNGMTVVGVSACVHPDNFDRARGRSAALNKACSQVGDLLAFRLRDELAREQMTRGPRA